MARFKITPVNIRNGNTAPYSIEDLDENKDLESQAQELSHLTKRFPGTWRPSISKLRPCKIDIKNY